MTPMPSRPELCFETSSCLKPGYTSVPWQPGAGLHNTITRQPYFMKH